MFQTLLVVIGAGALPELQMSAACSSLAAEFGAGLMEEGCGLSPHSLLSELTAKTSASSPLTVLRLSGDVGVDESGEGSWMEALAAWRVPVLMLAQPRPDGRFSGIVPASVAFARELNLSLLGLVQLGGEWDAPARRHDGLPWCGCLQGPDDDPRGLISCLQHRQGVLARGEAAGSA
ncbi:hypothetical protein [Synechococcus sp. UW179A]|uniref:hypothetical protein n=1 Tax=Synechococcus sp. UW179A TaxID=2575510 RepID=UPI000E0E770E|nr:hypothetical protein [Synechococcus sp. UW179A]